MTARQDFEALVPELREAFETWAKERRGNILRHVERQDQYASSTVQGWWNAYQAADKAATERAARKCLDLKPPNLDHSAGEYHRFDITTLACAAAIRETPK